MPAKRHKAVELESVQQPKRRVTRSSTRSNLLTEEQIPEIPCKFERKSPIPKGKSATSKAQDKTSPESATAEISPRSKATDTSNSRDTNSKVPNVTTLTITSDLVKNPINCHQYTPLSPATATPTTLVFTHGAGGTLSAPAVTHFCTGFSALFPILAFQGSMNLASRVQGFHACLPYVASERRKLAAKMKQKGIAGMVLLGGRSMGARAAVMAARDVLEGQDARGVPRVRLVLVSYPLVGAKGKDDLRDQILLDLPQAVDLLFVVGERDPMCPLELLNRTRGEMKAKTQVVVVKGADHGMRVVPSKWTETVGEKTGTAAAAWLQGRMHGDITHIGNNVEDEW